MRFILGIAEAGFFPAHLLPHALYPSRPALLAHGLDCGGPFPWPGVLGQPQMVLCMERLLPAPWALARLAVALPLEGHPLHRGRLLPSSISWIRASKEAKWLTPEQKAVLAANVLSEDQQKVEHKLSDAFTP